MKTDTTVKAFNVTVKDATTEESAYNKAKETLKFFKSAYAAIYGYTKDNKPTVWLVEPILCNNEQELITKQKAFNQNKMQNKVVLHTLFRRNVEE